MEEVRRLNTPEEIRAALSLCRRVFDEFVALDYTADGKETFYRVTEPDENIAKWRSGEYVFYGAMDGDKLKGAIASRSQGGHVMLLFVDKSCHRQGIAGKLMNALIADAPPGKVTVNASPYAVKAYQRMGFVPAGEAISEAGMTFTPMEYTK